MNNLKTEQEACEAKFGKDIRVLVVWQEACEWQRAQDAKILDVKTTDLLLMAGEMTAQELRTVKAVLKSMRTQILAAE